MQFVYNVTMLSYIVKQLASPAIYLSLQFRNTIYL